MKLLVPQLLVSVRSVREAEAAMAGGADLIDVKEPTHGPLGRADDDILDAIRLAVRGRRPVSAALGELRDFDGRVPAGFDFVKCGMANLADDWRTIWSRFYQAAAGNRAVVVAYADWQCAHAPPMDDVVECACSQTDAVLLIDTCCKDKNLHGRRATLFDWLPPAELEAIVARMHAAKGRIALAGSLTFADVPRIRELGPDWIAVRGAVCEANDRDAAVDGERVRQLKSLLSPLAPDTPGERGRR